MKAITGETTLAELAALLEAERMELTVKRETGVVTAKIARDSGGTVAKARGPSLVEAIARVVAMATVGEP